MANLLYLVHRLPYPPNKGDKVRSFHLLKHLAARHRVFLGTFIDDPQDEAYVDAVSQYVVDKHIARLSPRMAKLRSLTGLLHNEALTLIDMLGKLIVPACAAYSKQLAEGVAAKAGIGVDAPAEAAQVRLLTEKTAELIERTERLKAVVAAEPEELNARAMYEHEAVIPAMEAARQVADELEGRVGKEYWPMPSYADLLFYV